MELLDVLNKFIAITDTPEEFVSAQAHLIDDFKAITKILYNSGKQAEELKEKRIKSALQKLIVKNFDEEQIWQQIELQNGPSLSYFKKVISNLVKNAVIKTPHKLHNLIEESDKKNISENVKSKKKNINQNSANIISQKNKIKPSLTTNKTSIVDDRFFKLSELEKFLNDEDKKEEMKTNQASDDDDDDAIEYFDDHMSEEDDEEKLKSGRNARYEDFFDAVDGEQDENHDKENEEEADSDLNEGSDEDIEVEELNDNEEYDTRDVDEEMLDTKERKVSPELEKTKSLFQKKHEMLQQKIKALEDQQLSEKPWQLKGEVTAAARPENCLLEEHLKFDHIGRRAPVITEEDTLKLEEIIKQRIKDKAWDDVERKIKPPDNPFEYRRQISLNQEKSKKSLAEVYEQEYLKQQKSEKEDEETELPIHREIRNMMTSVFMKLDALSNFRYTPKPPQPDIKVVSNLPALTVEEVAPVSVSDANLLAPEEIKAKVKGTIKGKTERDITDRKRERRKKKLAQKIKSKKREKSQLSKLELDKKSKKDALKKIKKRRNITIIKDTGKVDKSLKSSKAFFSRLQDQSDVSVPVHKKRKK